MKTISTAIFRSIEDQLKERVPTSVNFVVLHPQTDLSWQLWEGQKSVIFYPYMRAGFFFLLVMPLTTLTYELANPAFPDNLITDMLELERCEE
jgi:hypothetical protein